MNRERALVLLSGGLDSTTILAMAISEHMEVTALSFRYGQKHTQELDRAEAIAKHFGVKEHLIIDLDPEPFRGSSLTEDKPIPENRKGISDQIPSTYVPARNTVFLSIALGIAESREADHIFIGVNSVDYSGYPDCRPEFIEAFQHLANLATKNAVKGNPPRIHAPLLYMTKAEIIKRGTELGIDYGMTLSCYQPNSTGESCGICDACTLRLEGFRANGLTDPARYRKTSDDD
ncbi:MAG: 7-cyano-7-deazaguanine synthase QueC [Candidatus Sabulitectum sp.]|nr:7-cyano-7-deazaguanine synthase QueC [Candidatus Sabulitectum sp.]